MGLFFFVLLRIKVAKIKPTYCTKTKTDVRTRSIALKTGEVSAEVKWFTFNRQNVCMIYCLTYGIAEHRRPFQNRRPKLKNNTTKTRWSSHAENSIPSSATTTTTTTSSTTTTTSQSKFVETVVFS